MRSLRLALIQSDGCPYKKNKFGHKERNKGCVPMEVWSCEDNSKMAAICKPRSEASEETDSADN